MAVDYMGFARDSKFPMQDIMNAFNLGLRARENKREEAKLEQLKELAKAKELKQQQAESDWKEYMESDGGVKSTARYLAKSPEYVGTFKKGFDALSSARREAAIGMQSKMLSALSQSDTTVALRLMDERLEATQNSEEEGPAKEQKLNAIKQFRDLIEKDPNTAKKITNVNLAIAMGPETFAKNYGALEGTEKVGRAPTSFEEYQKNPELYTEFKGLGAKSGRAPTSFEEYRNNPELYTAFKELGTKSGRAPTSFEEYLTNPEKYGTFKELGGKPREVFRPLTNEEKKKWGIPRDTPVQMGVDSGRIYPIGGSGTQITISEGGKFGVIPPGYVLKGDEENGYHMELIPNSPQEKAFKKEKERKIGRSEEKLQYARIVFEDIGRLRDKIKKSTWYNPTTGPLAKIMEKISATNAADAEELRASIVANIGFDRLFQMRQNSPTGGALGNISDKEVKFLQSVMGSISSSQTEEQLLHNLDRLETAYAQFLDKHGAMLEEEGLLVNGALTFPQDVKQTPKVEGIPDSLKKFLKK